MKKLVRKSMAVVMILTLVLSFMTVNVSAYNIGDVINYAQPTNIVASVNGYMMTSYNVDGYTYIVAEDLRYYGFNVTYDNASRALYIERNPEITEIKPHNTNPKFWSIGSEKVRKDILYTDIVTYVAGNKVNSYNINGETIICFNDLSNFGNVAYDDTRREISLEIADVMINPLSTLVDVIYEDDTTILSAKSDMEKMAKEGYGNHVTVDMYIREKGNILLFEYYLNGVVLNSTQKWVEQGSVDSQKEELKQAYQPVKDIMPELSGVSVVFYDDSNEIVVSTTAYFD